ncbi:MAG: ABC transporter ATP-binding protein [Chloroflexi bacterium]|nr:ABC transporter ATP-binding protein [Chloroflexota bacterium]
MLQVDDLRTYFFTRWGVVKSVDGVSFSVGRGEIFGLVGESGCGKSITCLSLMRLVPQPAGKIVGGRILFEGRDLLKLGESEMRRYRGRHISIILQDPMTSLNPVFTVGDQIAEPVRLHQRARGRDLWDRAASALRLLRIPDPETRLGDYPHQMSGGMRQRVVGAIALACEPHVLIADEATTALDATIQAQYLALLQEVHEKKGLSIIFVTHDFGIVAKMCHRVAVMYAGKIVEMASVRELFDHPAHPYTVALLDAVPPLDYRVERLASIEGQPPQLYKLPSGCSFSPRCPRSDSLCVRESPPQVTVDGGHWATCWRLVDA